MCEPEGERASLEQASRYLEGLINFERQPGHAYARLGLGPIRQLLEALGSPERGLSIVHVAGSKGKGSTCLIAEAILSELGERVGTFTSPHLTSWSERFRIAGQEVDGAALAAVVRRLRPHVDSMRRRHPESAPTFFDATTAAALMLFAEADVSRVLLEVGLGGRLDSTNAVSPSVTCVTSIELEHTDKLGNSLAAIAAEKAGILEPGVANVCGRLAPEAADVVRERAAQLEAPLFRLGREIEIEELSLPSRFDELRRVRYRESDGFGFETQLRLAGAHQADNAALAIAAVRRLGAATDTQLAAAASRALPALSLPARAECLARRPFVLVDSAHTEASARALAGVLSRLRARRLVLVLSVSSDKRLGPILRPLLPLTSLLVATRADARRSLDPARLGERARALRPGLEVDVVENPAEAIERARGLVGEPDALCCTGSIYLAGIARSLLGHGSAREPAR